MEFIGASKLHRQLSPRPDPYELGHPVGLSFLLGQNRTAAAGLTSFLAYHDGVEFAVTMVFSDPNRRTPLASLHDVTLANLRGTDPEPKDFHLQLTFSDGSSVDSSKVGPFVEPKGKGRVEVARSLTLLEGSGGGVKSHLLWFVAPIPPPGPIVFSIDWLEADISWHQEIDTKRLLQDAAQESQFLKMLSG